ncbi:MAG: DNA gyrase subunit A [Lachnospiraceae bacterium]|nr:DNA gyrase subunit A [Lachnospiraceae bacterium]
MDEHIFDKISDVDIKKTMEEYYIDYSMSVIAQRALPDVRDGLKPVQRRILFSMIELNNGPDKPHRKCARIVGDTMGKYHPHGDSSIYDALVKLAQDFSTRYPLVDGHGNFGSVDGDGAAAMRYTEARLSKISMEMLSDINKDTVDFVPNFDETEREPNVLPARYPNLLVNGTSGIAVGMATNIPPHNLGEVIGAVVKIIDNIVENDSDTTIDEVMDIVKGPDFPTGAIIKGRSGIEQAYRTGRGKIIVRAVTDIEPMDNGKNRIVVTEIPYMVNKERLIGKIGELVKNKRIDGITALRDESDRTGMRIVIELRRDVNANVILNRLFKYTQLQDTFGVIMLSLVNNEPKVLNLLEMLKYYLAHQEDVITRRTKYDLNKAEERAHILKGLITALDNIDRVISIIRGSANVSIAKESLIKEFELSEVQAQAIVDMRLRALTGLEREKIEDELKELQAKIKEYKEILNDRKKLLLVIRKEITEISEKYSDKRRTAIDSDITDFSDEDLIPNEPVIITRTNLGYIKRQSSDNFKNQKRGGKGIKGMQTVEYDYVEELFATMTHDSLLFFTNQGRVYKLKGYQIPESSRTSRGTAVINLLNLMPDEKISAIIPINKDVLSDENKLFMSTKSGIVKKTNIMEFANINKNGLRALTLSEDDELIGVRVTDGTKKIILVTKLGQCILFDENDVRSMGRTARGVKGINLSANDHVIGMQITPNIASDGNEEDYLLLVSENGFGKRTKISEFTPQKRGGKGVKCYKIVSKSGNLVGFKLVNDSQGLMIITDEGIIIKIKCNDISINGRVTTGVKLINLENDIKVAAIAKIDDINGESEDDISDKSESDEN